MRNVVKESVVLLTQKCNIGSHLCFWLITNTELSKQVSRIVRACERRVLPRRIC